MDILKFNVEVKRQQTSRHRTLCNTLQSFDAVAWVTGKTSGPQKNLSDEVLAWLCVWSEVQNDLHMVQMMPMPPYYLFFSKPQNGLSFWYQPTRVVMEKSH